MSSLNIPSKGTKTKSISQYSSSSESLSDLKENIIIHKKEVSIRDKSPMYDITLNKCKDMKHLKNKNTVFANQRKDLHLEQYNNNVIPKRRERINSLYPANTNNLDKLRLLLETELDFSKVESSNSEHMESPSIHEISQQNISRSNFYKRVDTNITSMRNTAQSNMFSPQRKLASDHYKVLSEYILSKNQNYAAGVQLYKLKIPNEFITIAEDEQEFLELSTKESNIQTHISSNKLKREFEIYYESQTDIKNVVWYNSMPFERKLINYLSFLFIFWIILYSVYVSLSGNKRLKEIVNCVAVSDNISRFGIETQYLLSIVQEIEAINM